MNVPDLIMVGVAPLNWRFGRLRDAEHKKVWACGPLRLSIHWFEE